MISSTKRNRTVSGETLTPKPPAKMSRSEVNLLSPSESDEDPRDKRLFDKLETLATRSDIAEIKIDIIKLTTELGGVQEELLTVTNALQFAQRETDTLKGEVGTLQKKVKNLELENYRQNILKDDVLKRQIDLEIYVRSENLILDGVPETDPRNEDTKEVVYKILEENLDIENARDIKFQAVHRLGQRSYAQVANRETKPRPIIMRFVMRPDRYIVWSKKSKLRTTGIWMREDLPGEVQRERMVLHQIARLAKDIKYKEEVYVVGPNLMVGKNKYPFSRINHLPDELHPRKLGTREVDGSVLFHGRYSIFSNFYEAQYEIDGNTYRTVEQYYQLEKAKCAGDNINIMKIQAAQDPAEQKRLGDKVRIRQADWEPAKRKEVMERAVLSKFVQNPLLKIKLLATGEKPIIECNKYDCFWSCGLDYKSDDAANSYKWKGENWLGSIITEVRGHLK